ncbi:MAG: hypothetical protein ACLQBD_26700 [Syntrophobacteraceae bacterium]
MDLIKKLIELAYYYRSDQGAGKPYWTDPTAIALVVSLIAMALVKAVGITLDADLQLKIVGAVTGIGALLSPHTGVVQHPASKAAEAAKAVQEHNLSNLS